jgi:hypothetical protein
MPDLATCQAASEPASPAPTMCTFSEREVVPVMLTQVAPDGRYDNARGEAGVVRFRSGRNISRYRFRPQLAECPNDQDRCRPVHDR